MVQVQRVNGRLVRVDTNATPLQQRINQQRLQRLQEQERQQLISAEAQRLDLEISNSNFGGSITEFNKIYNSIKESSPDVAAKLKYNPQTIQNEINIRKSELDSLLQKSEKKEKKARKDNNRVKKKGEQAYQKGIQQGISLLDQGTFTKVQQVKDFANDLKRQAEKEAKLSAFNTKLNTKLNTKTLEDKTLYVSRVPIGGGKTEYLVNGKWKDTKPKNEVIPLNQRKDVTTSGNTALITITDTGKNVKTITRVNLNTGQTLKTEQIKLSQQEIKKNVQKDISEKIKQDLAADIFTTNYVKDYNNLPIEAKQSANRFSQEISSLQSQGVIEKKTLNPNQILVPSRLEKLDKIREQTDPGAYKTLLGLGVFGVTLTTIPVKIVIGFADFIKKGAPLKEVVQGIKNTPTDIRNNLISISKGDPKALATTVFEFATLRGFRVPKLSQIKIPKVKEKLQTYKDNLITEKKIVQEYKKISPPLEKKKASDRLKQINKEINALDNGNFNGNTLGGKSSKNIANFEKRLAKRNEETIKKYFFTENKIKDKEIKISTSNSDIIKSTPKQIIDTANALFRGTDSTAFKRYVNKVKKLRGENLVRRKDSFVLLEPKEQRKKGVKTGKKATQKEIKKKPKEITLPAVEKLSVPQLDKLEKQLAKEVIQQRKSKLRFDKKGQLKITNSYKKGNKQRKGIIKTIRNEFRDFQSFINDTIKDYKRRNSIAINKKNKQKNFSQEDLKRMRGNKKKLSQDIKQELKKQNKLSNILKSIVILTPDIATASLSKQAQAILSDLLNLQKLVNEIKTPKFEDIKVPTPKIKTPGRPPKKTPLKLKQPKPKKPLVRRIPKRKKLRPVKAKRLRLPRLDLDSKPKEGQLSFDLKYRERKFISKPTGKGNPVIVKTKKLGLPFNKAVLKGFGAVDKTTQASAQLVVVGITKQKDIPKSRVNKLLNKFRITKSKNKDRLIFVEKNKNRIDTRGEKKGLSLSRALSPKKKKTNNKKAKKK